MQLSYAPTELILQTNELTNFVATLSSLGRLCRLDRGLGVGTAALEGQLAPQAFGQLQSVIVERPFEGPQRADEASFCVSRFAAVCLGRFVLVVRLVDVRLLNLVCRRRLNRTRHRAHFFKNK